MQTAQPPCSRLDSERPELQSGDPADPSKFQQAEGSDGQAPSGATGGRPGGEPLAKDLEDCGGGEVAPATLWATSLSWPCLNVPQSLMEF